MAFLTMRRKSRSVVVWDRIVVWSLDFSRLRHLNNDVAGCIIEENLFRSSLLSVREVRCRHPRGGRGEEECTRAPSLAFISRGVFVKHEGSRELVANANRVVCFNPRRSYRVSHPTDGGDICVSFTLSDELRHALGETSGRMKDAWTQEGIDAPADAVCSSRTFARQGRFVQDLRRGLLRDVDAEESALALLESLARDNGAEPPRPDRRRATREAHRAAVETVISRLAVHPTARVELSALARCACVSPFHLCRLFREHTTLTIQEYRLQLRLRAALHALAEGCEDLTTLALEQGFFDHSHLTRAFRRAFGASPRELRGPLARATLRETSNRLQV
ncbi:MAG: helix-turn-helix transcriptional regulator [Phycisphaerales bacterium]|nr:helix-turn-helix transcriptional regulator [Phycisphaerales bacterium]